MPFSLKGIGSGLKGAMQSDNFINALAGMQGGGGDDVFSKIMGGIGKGAGMAQQFKQAQHAKANAMTPPALTDTSAVPLAGPMGGAPPGVGDAGIPGMAPPAPAPSPEMVGAPPGVNSGDMSAGEGMADIGGGMGEDEDYLKKALRGMGRMGSVGF